MTAKPTTTANVPPAPPAEPVAPAGLAAPAAAPLEFATAPLEIKIRHVRFVTKGTLIASPREAEDHVEARKGPDIPKGYDIHFVESQRRFRFDRYEGGKWTAAKWLHESRIENYEEWDAAQPSSAE